MKTTFMMIALAGALAAPAAAQTGSSTSPTQHKPATHTATHQAKTAAQAGSAVAATDRAFAKEAAIGSMAEVDLGNLAKDKASSSDVKTFAERMVTDHSKANDELKQWADENHVTLPTQLDAKHKAMHDRLAKLSGDAFDKAYMRDMVSDHKADVAKFRSESKTAKNADLKAWAGKTLPTLEEHLKMAQDTAAKVGALTTAKRTPKK
jgi:putative membrane protein